MTKQTVSSQGPAAQAPLPLVILAQIVAGCVLGAGAGYLGTLVGGLVVPVDSGGGFRDVVAQLVGLVVGYPLGATGGVWLGGRLLGRPGSALAAALGAALGVAVALLLTPLFAGDAALLGWALLFTLGMLGALAGYHGVYRRLLGR
jgi:hypothetical protein